MYDDVVVGRPTSTISLFMWPIWIICASQHLQLLCKVWLLVKANLSVCRNVLRLIGSVTRKKISLWHAIVASLFTWTPVNEDVFDSIDIQYKTTMKLIAVIHNVSFISNGIAAHFSEFNKHMSCWWIWVSDFERKWQAWMAFGVFSDSRFLKTNHCNACKRVCVCVCALSGNWYSPC